MSMPKDVLYGKTLRKSFARTEEIMQMPNLLEIQKSSYQWFLDTGLRDVFKDVEAIRDYSGNLELSFIDYSMSPADAKYNVEECKARDATYAAPLKVRVRLRNRETDEIKEQEIFMGPFQVFVGLVHIHDAVVMVAVLRILQLGPEHVVHQTQRIDGLQVGVASSPVQLADIRLRRVEKHPLQEIVRPIHLHLDNELAALLVEAPDVHDGILAERRFGDNLRRQVFHTLNVVVFGGEGHKGVQETDEQIRMFAKHLLEGKVVARVEVSHSVPICF